MSDDPMQAGWDATVVACLEGHDDCSFGGMTPQAGYWLAADDCELNHGDWCAWCSAEATTGFVGWGDDVWSIWAVPACEEHAAEWVAAHPEWRRGPASALESTLEALGAVTDGLRSDRQAWLGNLDPVARSVVDEYVQRMADELLHGTGPRREGVELTGFTGLSDVLAAPATFVEYVPFMRLPKPPVPQPRRMRFNQATKMWEAQ